MIFNHASAKALSVTEHQAVEYLNDLSRGMAQLVNDGVVNFQMRLSKHYSEITCIGDNNFYGFIQMLRRYGHHDEFGFFIRLATKVPLINDASKDIAIRFMGCEGNAVPVGDSDPLIFCAISDGVLISLQSDPNWNKDILKVKFNELMDNGEIKSNSEEIDNLASCNHASLIFERHQSRVLNISDPREIWDRREEFFPKLLFGPSVEDDLQKNANNLGTIVGKLVALNQTVDEWQQVNSPDPKWQTYVTPESNKSMKDPEFRKSRTFPSQNGNQEVFEWHARYGGSGRIHFRFDRSNKELEVGYIGPHLPL